MHSLHRCLLVVALTAALGACGSDGATKPTGATKANEPIPTPPLTIQDVMELEPFAPLEPGTYLIDPDLDPSTPLRVEYEISADGWSQWIGATKFAKDGHVGVSIITVTNLVRHGCRDHSRPDPPIGPSVGDLASALAKLAPFRVTAPPTDVTIYGYRGKHLELTVPDLPMKGRGDDHRFTGCIGGQLKSWVDPLSQPNEGDAFYGYTGPGHTEEFWILDVEGSRLVIEANWSPGSPPDDMTEMRAILASIRIEP